MFEQYLTEADNAAIEQERQRAQETIARLEREKLDLQAKLRSHITSSEREVLGLKIQEIDRSLPAIMPEAGRQIERLKMKAYARHMTNQRVAQEQAEAAQAEANRQAAVKEQIGEAFVANGGTWLEFEQQWPTIRQQAATNAAVAAAPKVIEQSTGNKVQDATREALARKYGRAIA